MLDIKHGLSYRESDVREIIQKCQNIVASFVWKFSFSLYTSNHDITIWNKYQFWLENVSLFRKQLIRKIKSFRISNFDLNQWYNIVLTQKHLIWNF